MTGFQRCDLRLHKNESSVDGPFGMFVCQGIAVGCLAQILVYSSCVERAQSRKGHHFMSSISICNRQACLISMLEYQHSVKAMSSMSSGNR